MYKDDLSCELIESVDYRFVVEFSYDLESQSTVLFDQDGRMMTFQQYKEFDDYGKIKCLFTSNYEWECLYLASSFQYRSKERLYADGADGKWTNWTNKLIQTDDYQQYYLKRLTSEVEANL